MVMKYVMNFLSLLIIVYIGYSYYNIVLKEGYNDNRKYLEEQSNSYNDRLYNPQKIKPGEIANEINKCEIINETKQCSMLKNSSCGYCYESDRYLYGNKDNPLGFNNEPLTDVCPKDKWVLPGPNAEYECNRMQGQGICDKLKDCGSAIGPASICGWCPIENKAMVKDNNNEPKYKNDKTRADICEWSDPNKETTLISGVDKCKKMGQDFPCLQPNPKKGPHSSLCFQDLFNKSGCNTNIFDNIIDNTKYKLWNSLSYIDVFNSLKYYFKQTKSSNYKKAKKYNKLCLNNDIDPCNIKYMNSKEGRPMDCLKKLYKQTGCSDKGLLNPIYEKEWANYSGMPYIRERKFKGNNKLQVNMANKAINYHRKIVSNEDYVKKVKEIKNKADRYNSNLNKENMNDAILMNKACYGKYPDIPASFNKPCWVDFKLRMKTIKGITIKSNNTLIINNNEFRLGGRSSIKKSEYEEKYFPFWDYDRIAKKYWNSNWDKFKKIVLNLPWTKDGGNDTIIILPKCILTNITNHKLQGPPNAYIFRQSGKNRLITLKNYNHPNYPYWAIINMANSYY